MMNDDEIRRAIQTRMAVPLILAGRALGLGRRVAKAAGEAGDIPVIPAGGKEVVPTAWLREKLRLNENQ